MSVEIGFLPVEFNRCLAHQEVFGHGMQFTVFEIPSPLVEVENY